MVSEALDGLTDEQLADLELQESGLVSGQSEGAIASTPFGQRMALPLAAPQPEPSEPEALSEFQLNQLEEENYRRIDYVMTPQEFDQYWDRREKEDNEVGRFIEGLGQGAAGLIGMVPEAGRELRDAAVGMVTDPVNQVQRNVQTGAEMIRKAGINFVQLFDWVSNKVDDLATSSKRAEAINAGIRAQLQTEGKFTGNREQDEQIYQAALAQAREAGAYKPTAEQVREDRQTAYERYVREKGLERDFANVSQFTTGESQMSVPTSAETYQITDEQPMQTVSTLGSMALDPVNLVPVGAGALSKARVLRRMARLSEKPLGGVERAAGGLADLAERIELGISNRIQDATGLTQKQQAALGAGIAGTAVYVDSATDGGGGLSKAVIMAGSVLPALHYGGGLIRKAGTAAGGAATIVREAGVGGLGAARAEAAAGLAGNAAIPERYRRFFTGYVDGTDSTLKRVAQDAGNPEGLRRAARFADRLGATQVARAADDAVSGAVTAGIVGTPFAALQPDAERAGEVMGGILTLGAAGGMVGGLARRRSPEVVDADIARMFADIQAIGGDVDGFAQLPHATLDKISSMQGILAGKVDFIPLKADEYRQNVDKSGKNGESTAGLFMDKDGTGRARLYINMGASRDPAVIAPHEIGHAILTSNVLDGQPRNDLRNLVNQQYGPDGVASRGREYIGRMVDAEIRQGVTGEMPTVLTEAEMAMFDSGRTMEDIVAERAKDPAERERLINERMEEFNQRSIDKGEDPLDWARDEIIAETFASEAPAIDFRAIRRDAMFPRLAESMLSAGGRVLEMFGANLSSTGRLLDNPSTLFRDNPLFQDRIMQKRVREYVRSYDQFLSGLEEAGSATPRGVELARSNKPQDLANSTHVKLRDEGRGVVENDFLFQRPDGTYSFKPQKLINQTEASRAAQIKTLYDARKFVAVNSTEFGKRKVNGRETIGGPVLPPQFDLFTHFPKHVREFARAMEQSRAEGGSWDIDYNAIGTGSSGRYRITNMGAVRAIQRETVPFGWQVTKQNHLLAASLDLNAFRASAMKAINKGELGVFNNDMRQVETDLKTYLGNHRNGLPGEAGIGQAKRDMLNGLIGTGTAVQRTANPLYYELNPKGSIRTWRVDRLNDAKPTGRTGYFFDYDKINNNRMPQALPREAQAMPDVPANLSTDQILRELEENQGYLGLSTLGMREGRPVKGGVQRTRELLRRNEELNAELRRRGGTQEESDVDRVLRQRGQAMPDADYMAAVQRGDENAARKIMEDAIKPSLFFEHVTKGKVRPFWHHKRTAEDFTTFRTPAWFSKNKEYVQELKGPIDYKPSDLEASRPYFLTPDIIDKGSFKDHRVLSIDGVDLARTAWKGKTWEEKLPFIELPDRDQVYPFHDWQYGEGVLEQPGVMDAIKEQGYQIIHIKERGFDTYAVLDASIIKPADAVLRDEAGNVIPPSQRFGKATGGTRGQAMPDVGSFDESVGGFVVDAGDDVSLPVHQQAVRGKPALDATGKPKYIQLGYDLLDAPGIKEYSGPGPEDTTKPDYKALAYDTTLKGQKQINDAIDSGTVDNAANRIVSLTQEAMKNPEIAAGMGWYSRMRKYLLDALGEEGRELLSQLLGATSAKTPVEQNFLQAMDALEGIRAGRYEGNRKSYLEMLAAEEGNNLTALIVERGYVSQVRKMADDLSKLSRSLKGEKKKAALAEAAKLRTLAKTPASKWTKKDRFSIMINATGMVPLRSNGKKFNANSMAVLKVIAGTWLDNRNSPKTPNFAGNLSGRTVQATIDVWAARLLRETLYEGSNKPWRIQPRSETGVNNQDFALGQIIMQRAAKKLDMNPDDLQAVLWFAEKHRWDERGWTKNQGAEKSSFDEVFKVFFPKGKKPLTFAEASKIFEEKE